jgi:hypothetical protein
MHVGLRYSRLLRAVAPQLQGSDGGANGWVHGYATDFHDFHDGDGDDDDDDDDPVSFYIYTHVYVPFSRSLSLSLCLLLVTTIYDPVMDDSTDSEVKEDAETCRQLLDDSWLGTAMTYRQNPTEVLFFSH